MMQPLMTPLEDATLAFLRGMEAWEQSLKRKDMKERDRVAGALAAYQRQLDACAIIAATKGVGDLLGEERRYGGSEDQAHEATPPAGQADDEARQAGEAQARPARRSHRVDTGKEDT